MITAEHLRKTFPGKGKKAKLRTKTVKIGQKSCSITPASTGAVTVKLNDEAGMRGYRRGGAQVSELHANFLINTGEATAADIEGLGEDVRAAVKAKHGIELEWEIKRIGRA